MRYKKILISWLAASAGLLSSSVYSQGDASAFPVRPVTIVVPYAAGGIAGNETLVYTGKMSALTGQQFLIDYKAGATGTIGTAYVAKARPDGYTLLVVTGGFTIFPAFYKDLPFDTVKDFAPVSWLSQRTSVLLVNASFPAKNFAEYIAQVRANPGKLNFGTAGAGGVNHLAGAWIDSATNTKVTYVHFKGTPLTEVAAGRIDVVGTGLLSAMPLIRAGKVRAVALMGDERSSLLPGLGTIAEQGIPGYNFISWLGIVAPGATPPAIVNKLSEGFAKVARLPEVANTMEAEGGKSIGSTPAQLRQLIVTEIDRWKKVAQDSGIKLEE